MVLILSAGSLRVPPQEVNRQRTRQITVDGLEDLQLHLANLPGRIGVIRDEDKVPNGRREQLLVLGGNEESRHSHQLQVGALGVLDHLQITINDGHRQLEGFWSQMELQVDLVDPIDQHGTHLVGHLINRWVGIKH